MNIQGWLPLGLTGLISLLSKGLSRVFPSTQVESISSFALSLLNGPTLTSVHDYRKNHSFDYMDVCWQINVSAFNMLSRFISWLLSLFTVILETKKIKSVTVSTFPPSISHDVMGPDSMILVLRQLFHSPPSPSSRCSSVPLHFLPLGWYHLHIWGCSYFFQQSLFQLGIHPAWHFPWCNLHIS